MNWLSYDEAIMQEGEEGEVARTEFKEAHEAYAKAVEVADWLGLPYRSICCGAGFWTLSWIIGTGAGEWRRLRRRSGTRPPVPAYFFFQLLDRTDAEAHGFAYGYFITKDGSIGPFDESPEYLAAKEAEEWRRLEIQTTPTPLQLRSRAERQRAIRFELQARAK